MRIFGEHIRPVQLHHSITTNNRNRIFFSFFPLGFHIFIKLNTININKRPPQMPPNIIQIYTYTKFTTSIPVPDVE